MEQTEKMKAVVKKYLNISIFFIFLFTSFNTMAQEVVISSGANTSGNGGSVSYSVGQVVCQQSNGVEGSVACGVQQAYVITVVTSVEDSQGISLSVSAYPNPTTGLLILEVNELKITALRFQLIDLSGKVLKTENIISNKTSIAMSSLIPATYIVSVIKNNKEIKVFKVIKK